MPLIGRGISRATPDASEVYRRRGPLSVRSSPGVGLRAVSNDGNPRGSADARQRATRHPPEAAGMRAEENDTKPAPMFHRLPHRVPDATKPRPSTAVAAIAGGLRAASRHRKTEADNVMPSVVEPHARGSQFTRSPADSVNRIGDYAASRRRQRVPTRHITVDLAEHSNRQSRGGLSIASSRSARWAQRTRSSFRRALKYVAERAAVRSPFACSSADS